MWEQVGSVGVDAGNIWIGDACYVFHKSSEELAAHGLGKDWSDFADIISFKTSFDTDKYIEFSDGMLIESGYGDGVYPVQVRKNTDGRVVEVRVLFDMFDEEVPSASDENVEMFI
tara:strand:- start:105 stop:449 length:345 start_codon:yes stop_codon:yes gene_type:complete